MPTTQVRERPILFSAPMVRALLDGRKTQTRRVVKPQPCWSVAPLEFTNAPGYWAPNDAEDARRCPYGVPGDRLIFLCGWATEKKYHKTKPSRLPKSARIWTYFDGDKPEWCGRTRMGRHMPGWLRERMPRGDVTDVRVQRVQDISEEDAIPEGVPDTYGGWDVPPPWAGEPHEYDNRSTRENYALLWDSINGPGSWASNPWVWAITFEVVK